MGWYRTFLGIMALAAFVTAITVSIGYAVILGLWVMAMHVLIGYTVED